MRKTVLDFGSTSVVSITKEVVAKVLLTYPAESVTVIVQFE